jgi:hypothetical protein
MSFLGTIPVVYQFLLTRSCLGEGLLPRSIEYRLASNTYLVATKVRFKGGLISHQEMNSNRALRRRDPTRRRLPQPQPVRNAEPLARGEKVVTLSPSIEMR